MKKPPDLIVCLHPWSQLDLWHYLLVSMALNVHFPPFVLPHLSSSMNFLEPLWLDPYKPSLFVCRSAALNCEHHGSRLNLHDSQCLFSNMGTRSRFLLARMKFGTANCIISLKTLKPFQFWGAMEATKSVKFEIFAHEIVVKLIITALWRFRMNKVAPFLPFEVQVISYIASQDPNSVFLMLLSPRIKILLLRKSNE